MALGRLHPSGLPGDLSAYLSADNPAVYPGDLAPLAIGQLLPSLLYHVAHKDLAPGALPGSPRMPVPDLTCSADIKLNMRVLCWPSNNLIACSHRTLPQVRTYPRQSRQAIIFRLAALFGQANGSGR